jgi:hypothetical protein
MSLGLMSTVYNTQRSILKSGELGNTLMDQLLAHFILPVLIGSLLPEETKQRSRRRQLLSPKLALFLLAQVTFSAETLTASANPVLATPNLSHGSFRVLQ